MKYLIVLASGMADEAIAELADRTPIEAAHTPALGEVAHGGRMGSVATLLPELPASEEVALLSLLGYDPREHFTGEAGLAAADANFEIGENRIALLHNLATEADGVLVDHAAGQISQREAEALLGTLAGAIGRSDVSFHLGQGFRGVTLLPADQTFAAECAPPEKALGRPIEDHLPRGSGTELLLKLVELSRELFKEHDINRVRADLGENPANIFWPWGPGKPPELPSLQSRHGLHAAMVAAAGAPRGLGRLAGLTVPDVPGATGGYRTDYAAKAQAVLELIETHDLVVVHVASASEASLEGNLQGKIRVIEDIDAMLIAPLLSYVRDIGEARLMVVATHVASVLNRDRRRHDVPLAMYGAGVEPVRKGSFSETTARQGEIAVRHGHELLEYFLRS